MSEPLPPNLQGARDRALLVIGFAGGFRRSELAALDIEDVTETDDGLVLSLRRSKTDQEGQGSKVALPWDHIRNLFGPVVSRLESGGGRHYGGALFRGINKPRGACERTARGEFGGADCEESS